MGQRQGLQRKKILISYRVSITNALEPTAQQRTRCISSVQVSQWFGMEESLDDLLSVRQLCWLGHIARMNDECLSKELLLGWLPQCCPAHGTKLRWRDRVRKDLRKFSIDEGTW